MIHAPDATANDASAHSSAPPSGMHVGPARRMDVVDLTAGFGQKTVISGIRLEIEPNSVTALIGPRAVASRRSSAASTRCIARRRMRS